MKKKLLSILAVFLLTSCPGILCTAAAQQQFDKFLSISDVEKITGLKGVKQIFRSADAEGDLNYGRADGTLILSISFYPANAFASARSSKAGFKSAVPGVGDEAFVGPADGNRLYLLAFRKGLYTVVLNTELDGDTGTMMPIDQITAIAKIIASRM